MSYNKKPVVLIILDGWGQTDPGKYNAISLAKTPTYDRLLEIYPQTFLGATGTDVGLLENQMSGSESGHMNIGAGRVVKQDSRFISESIEDGSFFLNPALTGATRQVKNFNSQFHVMGLMGDSDSPHSNPEHFRAVLRLAKEAGVGQVFCHLFTDGRDSYPRSAKIHLKYFQKIIQEEGIGKIATMSGRFYAMDRSKNWDRLTKTYDAMVFSRGETAQSPEEAIEKAYAKNLTDEYLSPTVILENGQPVVKFKENDALIFFNLRSDRARQFSKLFVAMNKESIIEDDMPIIDKIKNLYFVAMTNFGPDLDVRTVLMSEPLSSTLPMALSNLRQLYTAESEKFAHITYFLNGGYADSVGGEDRIVVASPKVDSYAKIPEMSAQNVTYNVSNYIKNGIYDFIAVNFANADMVGHTGDLKATIRAVEFLDKQIKILVDEVLKREGALLITADHGNAENMFDEKTNQPNTFHTKNPVPFILVCDKLKGKKISSGGVLANITPTIIDVLGVKKPDIMKSQSLID